MAGQLGVCGSVRALYPHTGRGALRKTANHALWASGEEGGRNSETHRTMRDTSDIVSRYKAE